MKTILKLEQLVFFVAGLILLWKLQAPWWVFFPGLLISDISMLGYLINDKAGAFCYNIFHHQGLAVVIAGLGFFISVDWIVLLGVVLFTHSSMDRIVGYGLKFSTGFKHTHLGDL